MDEASKWSTIVVFRIMLAVVDALCEPQGVLLSIKGMLHDYVVLSPRSHALIVLHSYQECQILLRGIINSDLQEAWLYSLLIMCR